MSTIKTTYLQHPSASSPNLTLASDGSVSGGAGLGGLVHIATESFSGVSSVSLDNVFSVTYENYFVNVGPIVTSSTGADLTMRLRASGSDATGTDYDLQQLYAHLSNTPSAVSGSNAQYVISGSGTTLYSGYINLYRPFTAATTFANSFVWNNAPSLMLRGMVHDVASSYDGLSIYPSTGTFSGTIRIYGYANS